MKIIKYKKIKNKYRVYFDNEEVDLYEEIILKYNLLLKKEIDSKLLEEIKESNKNEEAYEKALNYINVKMRSRNELEKYLSKKEYDDLLIKNTIKRLENIGLINDELYIKSYISDKINLTKPSTNTREYGEAIASIANTLGGGKPIVQTLKDLKRGRRSNDERIKKGFVDPTLKDVVAGDLALVMPHRIITDIIEGLETLDKIIPGINNPETLLYGPEIKFFSNEIDTDNNFKIEGKNIYFVGDGAGKAGNIVAAAATGLVAARNILEREK